MSAMRMIYPQMAIDGATSPATLNVTLPTVDVIFQQRWVWDGITVFLWRHHATHQFTTPTGYSEYFFRFSQNKHLSNGISARIYNYTHWFL